MKSDRSEFVVVYGRRRVGKTFLIRQYFNNRFDFELTGLANANTSQQLKNFQASANKYLKTPLKEAPPNWFDAFQSLKSHLSRSRKKRKVIFLDELPWMDTARSDFLNSLEHFWNGWAAHRQDVVLIGCGSAASWMTNNLINNRGGLHNRVTGKIKLRPFNLGETEEFLTSNGNKLDRYQVVQLYMAMGGIPYYLQHVSPGKSAAQNIEEVFFSEGAMLEHEFSNLFVSLFKHAERHEKVVEALSSRSSGMSRSEIAQKAKMKTGGGLTRTLDELEKSGFISSSIPFNRKSRDIVYYLSDHYCWFYQKFLKNLNDHSAGSWTHQLDSPSYRSWSGFAFERVCQAHTQQIKKALGIQGIQSNTSTWRGKNSGKGAQIDLVIDRRDQVINLCEMKFSTGPFIVTKSYADDLRNKMAVFRNSTKTRKSIFLTMVTTFGVKQNEYASSMLQNEVKMDDLFEEV